MRKNKIEFKETDDDLENHLKKIVPDKRLTKQSQLKSFLEKRYQKPIAEHITNLLAPHFERNFSVVVQAQSYFKTITDFVNSDFE